MTTRTLTSAAVAVALFVGVVGGATPASAQASPEAAYVRSDPSYDVAFGGGDITAYSIDVGANVDLRVRTRTGVNPFTANAWQAPGTTTRIRWTIKWGPLVNRYFLHAAGDGAGGVNAQLVDFEGDVVCGATFQYYSGNGYRIVFPTSCLPPDPVQFLVKYTYHRYPFDPQGYDVDTAPDRGWSPAF